MVAEVEAMRKGIDMEQKRLAERSVALDRQKKEADLAARADIDRLAEEVRYRTTLGFFPGYNGKSLSSSICLSCGKIYSTVFNLCSCYILHAVSFLVVWLLLANGTSR